MSKMDALRAMREARYEQRTAAARKAAAAPQPAPAPRPVPARRRGRRTADTPAPADAGLPEERLCGHRAISGRTCTREAGHTAKSHRYA